MAVSTVAPPSRPRRWLRNGPRGPRYGPRQWAHGYAAMLLFEVTGQRFVQTILFVVQGVLGGGMALIYGYYLGDLTATESTYLAAGIPALALIPLGFVGVPVIVGYRRAAGSPDFMWSLPVPRPVAVAATLTVFTLLALPGTALVTALAAWRYDAAFHAGPAVLGAVLLGALASASVGYAVAQAVPDPRLAGPVGSLVMLALLLVVPIVAPLDRIPGALEWLPFHHMTAVIRDGLLAEGGSVGRSYLILAAWTVASWVVTAVAVGRRR